MSYLILSAGGTQFAGSTTPLIKKADRAAFVDAAAMLRRANAIADEANANLETARLEAIQQGYAEGAAAAEIEVDEATRRFADAIVQIEEYHTQQVAEAAYAATVAIIGEFGDNQLVTKLVTQVLAKQKEQNGLAVHVAPELQPKLAAFFDETGDVPVVADPDLGTAECHVMTANGRIIASLPVQLSVLRERWGLDNAGESA